MCVCVCVCVCSKRPRGRAVSATNVPGDPDLHANDQKSGNRASDKGPEDINFTLVKYLGTFKGRNSKCNEKPFILITPSVMKINGF